MNREETIQRMKELSSRLKEASRAYYQDAAEIMSNYEYDALYDELSALEKESGIILAGSPTQTVGYEVVSALPKERHPSPMLSLDKTKSVEDLASWLGDYEGVLSWKMDGLTIVLTYSGGKLIKAVTRGSGEVGEVVTSNAGFFDNLPMTIPFEGELVIRGEAVIKYSDFEKINAEIMDVDSKYKNPRNLCSGSVRAFDPNVTKGRHVNLFAFALISAEGLTFKTCHEQFEWMKSMGFEVVEYRQLKNGKDMADAVAYFSEAIVNNDFPSDGLVLTYDDIEYGLSLGKTAKYPRNAIAFKWQDEIAETTLLEIEWSASRTGLINPVAIFEPVELEGTTVSRASVHNVSILQELGLGIGDRITVYKANMIIPQIAENLTRSGKLDIPSICPVCGGEATIKDETGVKVLICTNPDCMAKHVKAFEHFVSRDAMNIEGINEATVETLISIGILKEFADIFRLENHREEIINLPGFGEKSYDNMVAAAKKASLTTPARLLNALGIEGIGTANAKLIARACDNDWERMQHMTPLELLSINGVGDVMAEAYVNYFANNKNNDIIEELLKYITFEEVKTDKGQQSLAGKTFVITGSLNGFKSRKDLQAIIEDMGGKVASSVSAKTTYLINNDNMSGSTKNKTAKELGIPIITEAEFMEIIK